MTDAIGGCSAALRQPQARKPDNLLALTKRLDQYRRAARRRGQYELAADLREARRLLLAFRLDEETWRAGKSPVDGCAA